MRVIENIRVVLLTSFMGPHYRSRLFIRSKILDIADHHAMQIDFLINIFAMHK